MTAVFLPRYRCEPLRKYYRRFLRLTANLSQPSIMEYSSILSDIDSHSLSTRCRIPSHGPPLCAGFSPDGDVLAIGNYYNEIRLHGSADGALIQTLKEHSNWPNNVAFSPDGRHLTSAARDGRVLIWKKGKSG